MALVSSFVPRPPRPRVWLRLRRLLGLPLRYWPVTLTLTIVAFVSGVLAFVSPCSPFGNGCCGGSRTKDTEIGVQALRGATTMFLAENPDGGCPSVADLIAGGYLDGDKSITNAWEHPMTIRCEGTRITVTSAGPDQIFGTDDDIE